MIEDVFHFLEIFGNYPKLFLRVIQALGLNVLDLFHRVLFLLSPFKFLVQEIENDKVQTPKIISSS